MNAFHTIAVPHRDILAGRLTMDVFAADLWEVSKNRGPDEYKNSEVFFEKTYVTEGLNNLLYIVEKRLSGRGGDPVIQIQTPFGGGKTHALIALYHKAKEWKAKLGVVVGTALGSEITLWDLLEKQLTGEIKNFKGQVSPGKEKIRNLLNENQPVLILMDEVLEYATKAAGVRVAESSLAYQTIAFMQELTEVIGTLKNASLIITLPSSIIEHYDENAERLFSQLQKVSGRVEKIYTPVQDREITRIIRRRLFSNIDEQEVKKIISNFMKYTEKEGLLPAGVEPGEYRERFLSSYPFVPEVVDVLYHRWGSFPSFQRTRGVLRLLSLVIYTLKGSSLPYLSLADFDLSNQEIRQELLKHIGAEFNGVIAADLTDPDAGAKKVDRSLGDAYRGLNIGTRAATSIFMYSFSGGQKKGVQITEIKRTATTIINPASVVAEATEQLKNKLFYLQNIGDNYFFNNQPNLNRIHLNKIENVKDNEVERLEKELLKRYVKGDKLKVYIWEENSANIPDTEELKLIIMKRQDDDLMQGMVTVKSQTPRVYRNTLIFLVPLESERPSFTAMLRNKLAYEAILEDSNLSLTDEQMKTVKKELKDLDDGLSEAVRKLYRAVFLPDKDGLKQIDLGIPTYGERKGPDQEVYEKLRIDGFIVEKLAPIVLIEKYLGEKDYVLTEQLYQSVLKTPGKTRPVSKAVVENCIREGVMKGLFGLGTLEDEKPVCTYYEEDASIAFSGSEILIRKSICDEQKRIKTESYEKPKKLEVPSGDEVGIHEHEPRESEEVQTTTVKKKEYIHLSFQVPKGKLNDILRMLNYLQSKFENIKLGITATEGGISDQEYEDKVLEAFGQLGIELDDKTGL